MKNEVPILAMLGEMCIAYKNLHVKFPGLAYYRFPANLERRAKWLSVFQLSEAKLKPHTLVCCHRFPDGQKDPEISLGKQFASPIKKGAPRMKRVNRRQQEKDFRETCSVGKSQSVTLAPQTWQVKRSHSVIIPTQFSLFTHVSTRHGLRFFVAFAKIEYRILLISCDSKFMRFTGI